MAARDELIAQARKKWEREQLVAQAQAKWQSSRAPAEAQPKTKAPEAALESFGNAATLGYLPHLQALAEPVTDRLFGALTGQEVSDGKSYIQRRDANIARQDLQKKEHPYAAGAGTVAGVLASAVGSGGLGAVAKGASGAQRLASATKTGATLGGLANPGDEKGDFAPLQLEARAKNAGIGAVLGAGGQLVAEGAGAAAGAASKALKEHAGKKAFRALGRGNSAQTEALAKKGKDVEIGRDLLDSGAIPAFGSTSRIAKRVAVAKEEADNLIGDILEQAGKGEKVFDSEALATKLRNNPDVEKWRKIPGMEGAVKAVEDAADTLGKNGMLTLEEANQLKRGIDRSINYNKKIPDMAGKQEGLFKTRTAVRDEQNALVNKMDPWAEKDALIAANKRSGSLSTAEEILEKELGREQRNRMVGLTDTIAGGAGLALGDTPEERLVYGVLLGALNKGGRKFGNSLQARGADAVAKQLAKIPRLSGIAEKNPAAFSAMVQRASEKLGLQSGITPNLRPQFAEEQNGERGVASQPLKGESLWLERGAKNLGLNPETTARISQTKQGKQLLMDAASMPKDSKALKRIQERLEKLK